MKRYYKMKLDDYSNEYYTTEDGSDTIYFHNTKNRSWIFYCDHGCCTCKTSEQDPCPEDVWEELNEEELMLELL